MDSENFKIKTEVFEGPLELLLLLIEKRKLHISDISLVTVTDDYISHIKEKEQMPMGESAHFILVASTLLLIKSKSLLPNLSLTEEEQGDIESLERRLKLYKLFKQQTQTLTQHFGKSVLFSKTPTQNIVPIFSPYKTCSIPHLYAHISSVLNNLPKKERLVEAVVQKIVSLEEMIEKLSERISQNLSLSFREFAGKDGTKTKEKKITVIIGFLAMLELVKRGILDVKQDSQFGEITMKTENVNTPRYT